MMLQAGPRQSWEKALSEHPASEHAELGALLPLLSAGSLGGRSTARSCLHSSPLPASCSRGGSLLGVTPRMRALGSIQTSQGAETPPSSSAPTGNGGCCTGRCCTGGCTGGLGERLCESHSHCAQSTRHGSLDGIIVQERKGKNWGCTPK